MESWLLSRLKLGATPSLGESLLLGMVVQSPAAFRGAPSLTPDFEFLLIFATFHCVFWQQSCVCNCDRVTPRWHIVTDTRGKVHEHSLPQKSWSGKKTHSKQNAGCWYFLLARRVYLLFLDEWPTLIVGAPSWQGGPLHSTLPVRTGCHTFRAKRRRHGQPATVHSTFTCCQAGGKGSKRSWCSWEPVFSESLQQSATAQIAALPLENFEDDWYLRTRVTNHRILVLYTVKH